MPTNANGSNAAPAPNAPGTVADVKSAAQQEAPQPNVDVAGLETAIRSGNYSAEQAYQYNQFKGDNQAARNLMLGSQQAMENPNVQTDITAQEAQAFPGAVQAQAAKAQAPQAVPPSAQANAPATTVPEQAPANAPSQAPDKATTQVPEQGAVDGRQTFVVPDKAGFMTGSERTAALGNIPVESGIKLKAQEERDRLDYENAKSASGQQMLQNIDAMRKQDPSIVGDRKRFYEMTGYAGKSEGEKRLVDAVWQKYNKPKSKDEYLRELLAGGEIFNKTLRNSPDYQWAEGLAKQAGTFGKMDSSSLYSLLRDNKIHPEIQSHLSSNPAFQQAKANFDKLQRASVSNAVAETMAGAATGKKDSAVQFNSVKDASDSVVNDFNGNKSYAELALKFGNTDKMRELSTKLAENDKKKNEITRAVNNMFEDYKKKMPGATMATVMQYVNAFTPGMRDELFILTNESNGLATQLKYESDFAKTQMDAAFKDLDRNYQLADEERSFQRNVWLEKHRQDLQKEMKQWERDFEEGDIGSSDKNIRNRAIKNTVKDEMTRFTELGAIFQRSAKEIELAISNRMDRGETAQQAIWNELTGPASSKPEVIAARNVASGRISDKDKLTAERDMVNLRHKNELEMSRLQQEAQAKLQAQKDAADLSAQREKSKADAEKAASTAAEKQDTGLLDALGVSFNVPGKSMYDVVFPGGVDSNVFVPPKTWTMVDYKIINEKSAFGFVTPEGDKISLVIPDNGLMLAYPPIRNNDGTWSIPSWMSGIQTGGETTMNVLEKGSTKFTDFNSWSKKKEAQFINLEDSGVVSAINRFNATKNTNDVNAVQAKAYLENMRQQAIESGDFVLGAKLTAGLESITGPALETFTKQKKVVDTISDYERVLRQNKDGGQASRVKGLISEINNKLEPNLPVTAQRGLFTALIPQVAKDVFGETGALTDRDIELYSKTIPTLKMNGDEQVVMMAMLKKMMYNTLRGTIETQVSGKRDASGFALQLKDAEDAYIYENKRMMEQLGIKDRSTF